MPVNVTLLGNRVFAEAQVKMRSSGWALMQCYWCPYKKGTLGHRDRHTQREDGVKKAIYTSTSTWGHQEKGLAQILPHPADIVIWDFGLQNHEATHACCGSPRLWNLLRSGADSYKMFEPCVPITAMPLENHVGSVVCVLVFLPPLKA